MTIVQNDNGNGQSYSDKTNKHPYIMVIDNEEEMLLILKHTLEIDGGEYSTNDSLLSEPCIARKMLRLSHKLSVMSREAWTLTTPLSPREMEILRYVAEGQPNKQIAYALGITKQTVKNHIASIMGKLNANDRTHCVVLAVRNGWINIEEVLETRSEKELALSLANS